MHCDNRLNWCYKVDIKCKYFVKQFMGLFILHLIISNDSRHPSQRQWRCKNCRVKFLKIQDLIFWLVFSEFFLPALETTYHNRIQYHPQRQHLPRPHIWTNIDNHGLDPISIELEGCIKSWLMCAKISSHFNFAEWLVRRTS